MTLIITDLCGFEQINADKFNQYKSVVYQHKLVSKLLYKNESYKIRGACFNVFNALGGGIQEKIIHRALSNELISLGFNINKEARINIFYRHQKIGTYIPDIIVDDKIIIEIKSKPSITKEDMKQFWGYLKGSKYKLGFLVIFSPKELIIKRFIHTIKSSV